MRRFRSPKSNRSSKPPTNQLKIALKLLGDKAIEKKVTLHQSATLCALEGLHFTFTSKLIDGTFPSYAHVIPRPSDNTVTIDRSTLLDALGRIEAVADDALALIVGLQWSASEPVLRLCLVKQPDIADDAVDAETSGAGRIAVSVKLLAELLDGLASKRVQLDADGAAGALSIGDPEDADYTSVLSPCAWINHQKAATEQAK